MTTKLKRSSRVVAAVTAVLLCGLVAQQGDVAAATLQSRMVLRLQATLSNPLDLVTGSAPLAIERIQDLSNGSGLNQANVIWTDTRTLAASTTENLDFNGGGLTDAFGAPIALVRVKTVIVVASAGNTNNVVVGGNVNEVPLLSTAATTLALKPGGIYVFTDPSAGGTVVTPATGDIIQIANSGAGTSVTYDVIVIGASS